MTTRIQDKTRPWPTKFPLVADHGDKWEFDVTNATEQELERFAYWDQKIEEIKAEPGIYHKVHIK